MKKSTRVRYIVGLVILIPLLILLVNLQFGRLKTFQIISRSMEPTLLVGDHIFVREMKQYPKRGEIIVFHNPASPSELLVKRIIAVSEDTVVVKKGRVFVNGDLLAEAEALDLDDIEVNIAKHRFFVLGDNVNNSFDSFDFGPVDMSNIFGRPTFIYWPLSRFGSLH